MRAPRLSEAALAALLSGGALGAAAVAQEPPMPAGGGALRVSADPPRLVLGRDAAVDLRVAVPAEVEDVTLSASVGRVDGLRRVAGGFVARYRPPGDRIPQVAIVAALGRTPHGIEHGWAAIPMSGQGDARVRTQPGQEITLQIGDRTFGPRRAGVDGIAVIPVVVPPGVQEAHEGFRPVDLHVPETPLLYAVLERSTVLADRAERVRALAYVVAPHGAARRGDVPVFEPSRGTVAVAEREPGAVEATWTLPPGRAGEERLTVRMPAAPASRTVLKLDAVAGPPAVVAVSFDRDALEAGAAEPVTVTARALDAAGNAVPADLALSADGAELAGVRELEPGELEARVRAGPAFQGRREVRVAAVAVGLGISGARTLPLRSGEPALASFEDADGVLRSDGAHPALLHLRLTDRFGNPIATPPTVTAERGKVLAVAAASPGAFDVRYVAPEVSQPTRERLVATAGGARTTAEPLLLGPSPGRAVAVDVGLLTDLRGRFSDPVATAAVEAPTDWGELLARGLDPFLRAEFVGIPLDAGGAAALLGGAAVSRALGSAELHAGATVGVLATAHDGALAARLSLGVKVPARPLAPYLDASLLGAGRGAPGGFAAFAVSVGVRLSLEAPHGDDPHRR